MKQSLNIRQAKKSDASSIVSLLAQLGYPDFDMAAAAERISIHKKPGYRMLVGQIKGEVVGFITLHWFELGHWKGRMGRITSFCIDEGHRSQGVGAQLLREGEGILFKQKCIKIEVTSNLRRTRAHAFYLRSGYKEDSRRFVKYQG